MSQKFYSFFKAVCELNKALGILGKLYDGVSGAIIAQIQKVYLLSIELTLLYKPDFRWRRLLSCD
jgi:hypothetical protein